MFGVHKFTSWVFEFQDQLRRLYKQWRIIRGKPDPYIEEVKKKGKIGNVIAMHPYPGWPPAGPPKGEIWPRHGQPLDELLVIAKTEKGEGG